MTLQEYIDRNPFVYHLTDTGNLPSIIANQRILSTKDIVQASTIPNQQSFLEGKRFGHTDVVVDGVNHRIRDQRPISEIVLARSLTNNWTNEQFIFSLNSRVFFWPNLNRLRRHFDRYADEQPVILRFRSQDLLNLYPNAEFCRLNSGATRCSSHWGGNAPERGPNTFQVASVFQQRPSDVAEVTIPNFANLPDEMWTANNPNGPWTLYSF